MQNGSQAQWLPDGETAFKRMLAAIDVARESVRLETYIFAAGVPGDLFLAVLTAVATRGVKVEVLVDGFGSRALPDGYWKRLREAGGDVRVFNPLSLNRLAIRDHRKLLLIDERIAFIGGFNIAAEYAGNGITHGWCDFGLELRGSVAQVLGDSFRLLFAHHVFRHPRLGRWRRTPLRRALRDHSPEQVLATGPGFGRNLFQRRLLHDLGRARDVEIVAAYFVPVFRLRRALRQVVRRGGKVQLLLAGRSDVSLAQRAGRAFFGSLLRAGIGIDEYLPQVLHAKLAIVDDAVFVGSSNLDARSLAINYEVMVRLEDRALAAEGRRLIAAARQHAAPVRQRPKGLLLRLREQWARFLLTRVDLWLARRQLRRLV